MDDKLAAYRAKKKREELVHNVKTRVIKLFQSTPSKEKQCDKEQKEPMIDQKVNLYEEEEAEPFIVEDEVDDSINCSWRDIAFYVLVFIFWASLYGVFIQIGFGSIYFIVTALIFIYFNTGTRKRRKGEASAYSVFNPNCESIDGTVKAEDLQRQMTFGGLF